MWKTKSRLWAAQTKQTVTTHTAWSCLQQTNTSKVQGPCLLSSILCQNATDWWSNGHSLTGEGWKLPEKKGKAISPQRMNNSLCLSLCQHPVKSASLHQGQNVWRQQPEIRLELVSDCVAPRRREGVRRGGWNQKSSPAHNRQHCYIEVLWRDVTSYFTQALPQAAAQPVHSD